MATLVLPDQKLLLNSPTRTPRCVTFLPCPLNLLIHTSTKTQQETALLRTLFALPPLAPSPLWVRARVPNVYLKVALTSLRTLQFKVAPQVVHTPRPFPPALQARP